METDKRTGLVSSSRIGMFVEASEELEFMMALSEANRTTFLRIDFVSTVWTKPISSLYQRIRRNGTYLTQKDGRDREDHCREKRRRGAWKEIRIVLPKRVRENVRPPIVRPR